MLYCKHLQGFKNTEVDVCAENNVNYLNRKIKKQSNDHVLLLNRFIFALLCKNLQK